MTKDAESEQLHGLIEKIAARFDEEEHVVETTAYHQGPSAGQPPVDLAEKAKIHGLARAAGNQAEQDPATLVRYAIWTGFLRSHLIEVERLVARNASQTEIRRDLVGVINSLGAFQVIQTLFDDNEVIPDWLEQAGE